MDRLSALIICGALAVSACDEGKRRPTGRTERVNAVRAAPKQKVRVEDFCDVYHPDEAAPAFSLPKLATTEPKVAGGRWRWVNVWATWCKPCIEEMPTLLLWHQRLARDGKPVDLRFLSVDATGEEVEAFRKQRPETPDSLRVENPDDLEPWVLSLGLDANAAIPIHAFVADGRLRCVRTGALGPNHFETVQSLLAR